MYETAITGSLLGGGGGGGGGGGAMHFSKGGTAITIQLSSPVAMGDNGHLQP